MRPAPDHTTEIDVAGDIGGRPGRENDARDQRARTVRFGEERAREDKRADPRRASEQLAQHPARRGRVAERAGRALTRRRPPAPSSGDRNAATRRRRAVAPARSAPVDLPSRRSAACRRSRPGGPTRARRERACDADGHPLGGGDGPADSRAATDTPSSAWASANTPKLGAAALAIEASAESCRAGSEDAPQREAAADRAQRDRRQSRRQPRHCPQLARCSSGDTQVVCNIRQHRRQHDQAGLGREEAQEERHPDSGLGAPPTGQSFRILHAWIVLRSGGLRNRAAPCLRVRSTRTRGRSSRLLAGCWRRVIGRRDAERAA